MFSWGQNSKDSKPSKKDDDKDTKGKKSDRTSNTQLRSTWAGIFKKDSSKTPEPSLTQSSQVDDPKSQPRLAIRYLPVSVLAKHGLLSDTHYVIFQTLQYELDDSKCLQELANSLSAKPSSISAQLTCVTLESLLELKGPEMTTQCLSKLNNSSPKPWSLADMLHEATEHDLACIVVIFEMVCIFDPLIKTTMPARVYHKDTEFLKQFLPLLGNRKMTVLKESADMLSYPRHAQLLTYVLDAGGCLSKSEFVSFLDHLVERYQHHCEPNRALGLVIGYIVAYSVTEMERLKESLAPAKAFLLLRTAFEDTKYEEAFLKTLELLKAKPELYQLIEDNYVYWLKNRSS